MRRHFFDKATGEMFGRMEKHLRGYEVGISGWNKAEDKYIVYAGGDRTMGAYYLYDVKADTMTKLADLAPWIEEQQMAEMTPVTYTSRDGLEIEGYLTLPVGKTLHNAKNLPVVVNPHGGPWARDSWGFNPEVQFLANRGYAVLQMNFRGSTGFGRKFTEIAYGKWGQTMQDDITDGVNWLIEKASPIPRRSPSTAAATAVTPRCRVSSRIPTSMPAPWTTWAYRTSSRSCKPSLPTGNRCST